MPLPTPNRHSVKSKKFRQKGHSLSRKIFEILRQHLPQKFMLGMSHCFDEIFVVRGEKKGLPALRIRAESPQRLCQTLKVILIRHTRPFPNLRKNFRVVVLEFK